MGKKYYTGVLVSFDTSLRAFTFTESGSTGVHVHLSLDVKKKGIKFDSLTIDWIFVVRTLGVNGFKYHNEQ